MQIRTDLLQEGLTFVKISSLLLKIVAKKPTCVFWIIIDCIII